MAFRTWSKLLLTALGVSMLAGAGQLGIAYGFGIVRLTGSFADVNRWPAQLVWVGWFAASAAVVGAVLTERSFRREGLPATTAQLSIAAAAALGATVVVPLSMQPARAAELASIHPVGAVGVCAILGAVIGAAAAVAVLLRTPLGWNAAVTAGVLWLLALVSVLPSLTGNGPLQTVRLGVLEPSWVDPESAQRLAVLVLPMVALLAGAASGALARWRGHLPLVGGASGAAGPVLVAFAYLTAGPGEAVDRYQTAPYYGALIAVAAGVLGSTAATLVRRTPVPGAAPDDAIEPTDILGPLPTAPALTATASTTADATGTARGGVGPGADVAIAGAGRPSTGVGEPAAPGDLIERAGIAGDATAPQATPAHWDWPATDPAPADAAGQPAPAAAPHEPAPPSEPAAAAQPRPVPAEQTASIPLTAAGPDPAEETASIPLTAAAPDPAEETAPIPLTAAAPDPAEQTAPIPLTATAGAAAADPAEQTASIPLTAAADPGAPDPAERTAPALVEPRDGHATSTPIVPSDDAASPTKPRPARRKTRPAAVAPDVEPSGTDIPVAEQPPAGPDAPPAPRAASNPKPRSTSSSPAPVGPPPAVPRPVGPPPTAPDPLGPPPAAPAPVAPPPSVPASTSGKALAGPAAAGTATPSAERSTDAGTEHTVDARPVRPVAPAPVWPTPPRTTVEQGPDVPTPVDWPRPRHRAPLPDLARASSWDALVSAARGGPSAPVEDAHSRPGAGDVSRALPADRTVGQRARAGATGEAVPALAAEEPTGKSRARRGLFRRNKPRDADGRTLAANDRGREQEPLTAHDEEFVDWVTGLARPVPDADAEARKTGRSKRGPGRHHRD